MYVLENTADHPNLVYRIDLANGRLESGPSRLAKSRETYISAAGRFAYSVDQEHAVISRADLSRKPPALTNFIAGPRTELLGPIGVAADARGRVCALESEPAAILCYAPGARGDTAPASVVDLRRLLGYAQAWSVIFDRSGRLVVNGTSDQNGLGNFAIAVIDVAGSAPRIIRILSGPNTQIAGSALAMDDGGDILALQLPTSEGLRDGALLAFGPDQRGDVAPRYVRRPAARVLRPFRLAVDRQTGDVAILGADGVALFRNAARKPLPEYPAEIRLPYRGWSIAFGGRSSLIVENEFGALETTLDLNDPQFIATDQQGRVYVASTTGLVTALPEHGAVDGLPRAWNFDAVFAQSVDAFAPDSAGYSYLSSASNDAIIAVEPEGRQTVIRGSETGLNHPLGLAVDRDGSLVVANANAKSILIFARGSSGNATPAARIEGPATQLIAPKALAIDAAGKLYVFDGPQTTSLGGAPHDVRVYAASATGNVAPLRSYEVNTKCWTNAL